MSLEILNPGVQSLVQDAGRFGLARYGVPRSGAFDHGAYALANLLVGNAVPPIHEANPGPAGLEVLLGGLRVQAGRDLLMAVTGAIGSITILDRDSDDKREVAPGQAFVLTTGSRLHVGAPRGGIRSYVGVAGGIAAEYTLGSRSTDTTSRIGPKALAKGQVLAIDGAESTPKASPQVQLEGQKQADSFKNVRFMAGPHVDLLTGGIESLSEVRSWTVTPASSRAGVRLAATELNERLRIGAASLASEATMAGAVQALPSGELIVLGPDGPTTGGYPVVAVLPRESLNAISQARPGSLLRLIHDSAAV